MPAPEVGNTFGEDKAIKLMEQMGELMESIEDATKKGDMSKDKEFLEIFTTKIEPMVAETVKLLLEENNKPALVSLQNEVMPAFFKVWNAYFDMVDEKQNKNKKNGNKTGGAGGAKRKTAKKRHIRRH